MNILSGENYSIDYDENLSRLTMAGVLRLQGIEEYAPVSDFIASTLLGSNNLTIDLTPLEFLNSSGIAMLAKIVISARKEKANMRIEGTSSTPWQKKSLNNLKRLMPELDLSITD